jgi:chromosome segregation ATPase
MNSKEMILADTRAGEQRYKDFNKSISTAEELLIHLYERQELVESLRNQAVEEMSLDNAKYQKTLTDLSGSQSDLEKLEFEVSGARRLLISVMANVSAQEIALEGIRDEVSVLESRRDLYQKQVSDLETKQRSVEQEYAELKKRQTELQCLIDAAESHHSQIQFEMAETSERKLRLDSEIAKSSLEHRALLDGIAILKGELVGFSGDVKHQTVAQNEAQIVRSAAKRQFCEAGDELSRTKREFDLLRANIDKAQKHHDNLIDDIVKSPRSIGGQGSAIQSHDTPRRRRDPAKLFTTPETDSEIKVATPAFCGYDSLSTK